MKKYWLPILIGIIEIIIALLGELMPEKIKNDFENWSSSFFGVDYWIFWIIVILISSGISLFLVFLSLRKSAKNDKTKSEKNKIHQNHSGTGDNVGRDKIIGK